MSPRGEIAFPMGRFKRTDGPLSIDAAIGDQWRWWVYQTTAPAMITTTDAMVSAKLTAGGIRGGIGPLCHACRARTTVLVSSGSGERRRAHRRSALGPGC
jgi:hypothetical protein